jgi:hypothetical protein
MTEYEPHPIALLFPEMTAEEYADLKQDMLERKAKGLPPLEHSILLYQGKILDGRHRNKAWRELGIEGDPPVEVFDPEKHGTLAAWMRAKSLNLVHRHIPADRKAAIFLKASEDFRELRAVIGRIKQANLEKQKQGKPSEVGDQGGTTAQQVGKFAGVGATAVKQVQKLQKEAPDLFEQVRQGKISAKKALQEAKRRKEEAAAEAAEAKAKKGLKLGPGDLVYKVEAYHPKVAGSPKIIESEVRSVDKEAFACAGGKRLHKTEAFTLDGAKAERIKRIQKEIADLEADLKRLKAALKEQPTIVPAKKAPG